MQAHRFRTTAGLTVASVALAVLVPAAAAQDPVKVAPNNYKVVFENDDVRVLDVSYKPGEKSAMHSHPDHVAYFLTAGKARFTGADGKTTDREEKAGAAAWAPADTHMVENTGPAEFRVVVVELKKPAAKDFKGAATPEKEDPARLSPNETKVVLDNDRVRVITVTLKPGGKEPMHAHPAYVAYALTDAKIKFTGADGAVSEKSLSKGQANWSGPVSHALENVGGEARLLAVELKPAAGAAKDAKAAPKAEDKK